MVAGGGGCVRDAVYTAVPQKYCAVWTIIALCGVCLSSIAVWLVGDYKCDEEVGGCGKPGTTSIRERIIVPPK